MIINEADLGQIIDALRRLHQTSIDQRLINLTDYLAELFQSINIEQSSIFRALTQLLRDYDDRAALKVDFLKAQCLETIHGKLNTDEANLQVVLEFLLELLNNSATVQEKFLQFNGYEKFFQALRYIRSPTNEFLQQWMLLMIDASTLQSEDLSDFAVDSFVILTNPHVARSLIRWIPYLNEPSHQRQIVSFVERVVLRSPQNQMLACSNGILTALLEILAMDEPDVKSIDDEVLSRVLSLVENLSRFSIRPWEIRLICRLFNRHAAFRMQLLHLLILAAKRDDSHAHSVSSYFDLQQSNSGIVLPTIARWPSPASSAASSTTSQHFTFHCWMRLNHELNSYPYGGRRQIYSLYSHSLGLEAFIRQSSLFVVVTDRREVVYVEMTDCEDLMDGRWHSLTIVHMAQRVSLFGSAFQSNVACNLLVYIDGLLRKEIKNFKYGSLANDPFTLASVGSTSRRPKSPESKQKNDSLSTTLVKSMQPLKGFLFSRTKTTAVRKENQELYSQNVMIIDSDVQDTALGSSICLYGQLACIWMLAEILDEEQVKCLHTMGPDFCHLFPSASSTDETPTSTAILDLLSSRSLLLYHPLACNGQICTDISGSFSSLHGRLINGSCSRVHSFPQSLLILGGCSILCPLFELFTEADYTVCEEASPSQAYNASDRHQIFYSNPVASIIHLIRCVLSSKSMSVLTEQFTKYLNVEIFADCLNHLSAHFLDQQMLISVEELIESSRLANPSPLLTGQLVEHVLLDFALWKKSNHYVRLLHLQYTFKTLREEKKFDRDKFGLQFFLDVLKQHFNVPDDRMEGEHELREIVYDILKYLVHSHLQLKSFSIILSTLSAIAPHNDTIAYELLEFIAGSMTQPSTCGEAVIEYLCEPNMAEGLYALLVVNNLSGKTKEMVMKIIKCCLGSKRASPEVAARLRLETNQTGFGGIIAGLAMDEFNEPVVEEILNLVITSNSPIAVHHLHIVLTLCSAGSLNVRYIAMRKLMAYFLSHPTACCLYAKCHGWQETLAHFFVQGRRSSSVHLTAPLTISSTTGRLSYAKEYRRSISRESTHRERLSAPVLDTPERNDSPTEKPNLQPAENVLVDSDGEQLDALRDSSSSPTNSRDITIELPTPTNETVKSPTLSASDSREDLLILLRKEGSEEHLDEMTASNNDLSISLQPTVIDLRRESRKSVGDLTFFSQSSVNSGEGGMLEEMCETLILAIVMVLWKGIVEHDDAAWTSRGQMFSAFRRLQREYGLYLPVSHIERRILELSMEAVLNDIRLEKEHGADRSYLRRLSLTGARKANPAHESNCRELIKLVNDFLLNSTDHHERITQSLVHGIITILDTVVIMKLSETSHSTTHDDHFSETTLTGINILLILLAHPNVLVCGQAANRLHLILDHRPLTGQEEAAYLVSRINRVFSSVSEVEDSEYHVQLFSLMRTVLEKAFAFLTMNVSVLPVPLRPEVLSTVDEFRQYMSSIEPADWQHFIEQITEPYADHYCSMSVRPFEMNMKIWWNECHELSNISVHKRNRQIGVEKLKFQSYIVDPWLRRSRINIQRTSRLAELRRIRRVRITDEWRDRKKYLYGECGIWSPTSSRSERRWMLSERENRHRMHCKLIENDRFNAHEESSRLRDNLNVDVVTSSDADGAKDAMRRGSRDGTHPNNERDLSHISIETKLLMSEERGKLIMAARCSLITAASIVDGEFLITDRYIYFFDSTPMKTCEHDLRYPLMWLQDIYLRRHSLRPTALEFFLVNQTSFLLNFNKYPSHFDKKLRRQIIQKLLSLRLPSMRNVTLSSSTPQAIFKDSKIMEKWLAYELSNFDYLMMLNTIAGRTYHDLNQYPVFPWILRDYVSQVLDLQNPDVFRDLSKPIGIQNPKHIEEVKMKYESFEDPTGLIKKFHYGTQYCNAPSVMHYLIRMEPFTTLHIQLQSGKFDIADRQFHSFQSSWLNILESPNDGKELIPEFFYLPEFLCNLNKFDLGKLQSSNQLLDDVQLPPWAHDSPEEFVRLHRMALESDYVSAHLHQWIDLIFGYKQTGQAAIDALNVFMYSSYEKGVDADAIDDDVTRDAIDGMIQNFGQIPSQLLTEPHPQRQTRQQVAQQLELQGRPLNMFQNLTNIKAYFVEIVSDSDKRSAPIVFICIPKNQTRSFIQQNIADTLITIDSTGVVGNNGWHPYDKSSTNSFTIDRDPTLHSQRNRLTTTAPFSLALNITSRLFAVSHDAKYIFSGGHWDWSLRTYSIPKTKSIHTIIRHTDVITCVTLDSTGYVLVTGSRDTTCVVWYLTLNEQRVGAATSATNEQESSTLMTPERTLYGHTAEVTCVGVSSELDLVASGSLDGTCNIHTLERGVFVRTLRPTDASNDPVVNLKLSDERHLLIQTEKDETHLFLYSINGHLIRTRKFEYHVADMLVADQYIILAVNHGAPPERKNDSSVVARVIIKDLFQMTTIQTIRLRTEITCLHLTKDSSHLLVSVKDGKLFILAPERKLQSKRASRDLLNAH